MELDEIEQVGDAVHFNANLDGRVHKFIMTRQTIKDLANYRGSEPNNPLNPLAVFEDYQELIAIAAEKLIEAKVDDNPIYINSAIIDH
ncbi:MAG TPA: DUF1488 family protein [Methyloradius sp.]